MLLVIKRIGYKFDKNSGEIPEKRLESHHPLNKEFIGVDMKFSFRLWFAFVTETVSESCFEIEALVV
jgi:hypothetical protein